MECMFPFEFRTIPTLALFQKIRSQCGAVDLILELRRTCSAGQLGFNALCNMFHHITTCTDHSLVTGALTEDVSFLVFWRVDCCKSLRKLKPSLDKTWDHHPTNAIITMSTNKEKEERESKHIPIASGTSQPIHTFSCVTPLPDSNDIELTMRDL